MNNKTKTVALIVCALLAIILLIRYVLFTDQFEKWGTDLENLDTWKQQYMLDHPQATEKEADQALKSSLESLRERQENYKKEHPNASKEEMDKAFSDARSGAK